MAAQTDSVTSATRPDVGSLEFTRLGLGDALVDYQQGWELQRDLHAQVVAGERSPTVLMLEHAEVLTAGKRTQPGDLPQDGSDVINVDRGGRITWHGPGQLVSYQIDFDVATAQIPGRSGVWCGGDGNQPDLKIAAIGVRVSRGVTLHGLAINVTNDLSWAQNIVPCGIADAGVTSLARQRQSAPPSLSEVADRLEVHLRAALEPTVAPVPGRVG
jgi:lipoyl(octanoyl) transferase